MSLYEATFIGRQELSTADLDKLTDRFSKIITDNGGKVLKTEKWGLRNLAYIVKKNRKGHYVYLEIDAPYAAIKEFDRLIRLNEDVLRLMIIRAEQFDGKPTPMVAPDTERDYSQLNPLGNMREDVA